ncbi:MAG: KpsF/GutQ family sugar-phosphate isomerase [Saccharospirillaceae bacterium]|nr:KpsF/GutQ family sugar-phosphate isomerase [Pseudomonadales bacterium]NRB79645.1 KpsF/GutQ family sugar-phosphate isomerase [Saccharospirillaceae bacterium]
MTNFDFSKSALRTIELEAKAIRTLSHSITEDFLNACKLILNCKGRVIVTGMGKSGHIANKMAATFASTGTPSSFVHPAEASHGDMGMITSNDIVIALSNSGEVQEVVSIIPLLKRMGIKLISITSNDNSTLAKLSDFHLNNQIKQEACPLNLAPTSSTTATLVLGDALAIALMEARGFSADDFAFSHPGGALGKKLLLKVSQIMAKNNDIPKVKTGESLTNALLEMSQKGKGMTCVIDENNELAGIYTDGDLRRSIEQNVSFHECLIDEVMQKKPSTISMETLAAQAMFQMEEKSISSLICVDAEQNIVGVIHLHDLIRAGVA